MDTTTIVLSLAAVVLVSIAIVVVSQMRERARIERMRKITAMEDSYRRSNRLLDEIPPQYLSMELKLLLLQRQEEVCNSLASLKADLPLAQWQNETAELKQAIAEGKDQRPAVKIDTPEKSRYVQELLQSLFKMLEAMHKSGKIDAATAKKNLKYVLFLIHKTHADLNVFQAREHLKKNEIRKAIHAYHLASTELGKSRDNPWAIKAIKSFRTRIKELEASISSEDSPQPSTEGPSRLDRQWDNFLQDDEWKKKADYDD